MDKYRRFSSLRRLVFFFFLSCVLTELSAHDEVLVYKETDTGPLELLITKAIPSDQPVPAVIWFHGGGGNQKPGQFKEFAKALALIGVTSFDAAYATEADRAAEEKDVSKAIKNAKSAFRYVKAHAEKWGIDPERIMAGGGSFGGWLAACLGTVPSYNDDTDDLSISTLPRLNILFNPIVARSFFELPEAAPIDFVSETTPSTIIFNGTFDFIAPISECYQYQSKLKKLGVTCEVLHYPDMRHGFFNYAGGRNPYFYKTLGDLMLFLKSSEVLNPPKPPSPPKPAPVKTSEEPAGQ
ncbi:MAG: alpha/beta hydrolase [Opitutales bacterium]